MSLDMEMERGLGEFDTSSPSAMHSQVVKIESKSLSSGVSTHSALYGDDALCLDDETDEIVDPKHDPAYTLASMLVAGHEAGYAPDSLTMQIQAGLLR